jgi:hypothetical protein
MGVGIVLDPAHADFNGGAIGAGSYYWGGVHGTWFWVDPTRYPRRGEIAWLRRPYRLSRGDGITPGGPGRAARLRRLRYSRSCWARAAGYQAGSARVRSNAACFFRIRRTTGDQPMSVIIAELKLLNGNFIGLVMSRNSTTRVSSVLFHTSCS